MKTAQYLAAFGLALLLGLGAGQTLAQSATAEPEPAAQPATPADQTDQAGQTDDGAAMPRWETTPTIRPAASFLRSNCRRIWELRSPSTSEAPERPAFLKTKPDTRARA